MTFELAALIVVALLAVVLGLVCYHLLGRLETLERAVQGGLVPPTTRLSREQFERRFRTAKARSALAVEVDTGVLLVVGPEHTEQNDISQTIAQLPRTDLFSTRPIDQLDAKALGVATTPYLFVIDDKHIRSARPLAGTDDLIEALKQFT